MCTNELTSEYVTSYKALNVNLKVLFNDVILAKIFSFFTLKTLKEVNLVCQKWNDIAGSFIANQSTFVISFLENPFMIPETTNQTQKDGCEKVFDICEFRGPIKNLKLKGYIPWTTAPFQDFLEMKKESFEELIFMECTFVDEVEEILNYDLTSFISSISVKKLCVDCTAPPLRFYCTRLTLSMGALKLIENIKLSHCVLISNMKLCANKILLKENTFVQDGNEIKEIIINDFVDFQENVVCKLTGDMTFDLKRCTKVKLLDMNITKIINWSEPENSIENLTLWNSFSYERNNLAIKELTFCAVANVNLSLLPKTLERLTFSCWRFCQVYSNATVCLPGLRYLHLDENSISALDLFKSGVCPNLENFEFTSHFKESITFPSNMLPLSVETVKLNRLCECDYFYYSPMFFETRIEKLILQNFNWMEVIHSVEVFQPKHIIIYHPKYLYDEKHWYFICPYEVDYHHFYYRATSPHLFMFYRHCEHNFNYFLFNPRKCPKSIESFAVGKFLWVTNGKEFEKSFLSKVVDKKGEYYIFKDRKGTAIEENCFRNMTKI